MAEKKKIIIILFLLPLFIFMTSEEEEHKSNFFEFLGKTINFLVLFGGLAYLLRKPLRRFLEKRSQDIKLSLEEAEDLRNEAAEKAQQIQVRLAGLEKEIANIKEEAEKEGLREKERTIQLAQQEAERVKSFAQQEIELIFRSGMRELREYSAELATALAEQRIRKKMSLDIQSRFIDKSIERIEKIHEKSNSSKAIHPGAN